MFVVGQLKVMLSMLAVLASIFLYFYLTLRALLLFALILLLSTVVIDYAKGNDCNCENSRYGSFIDREVNRLARISDAVNHNRLIYLSFLNKAEEIYKNSKLNKVDFVLE